MQAFGLYIPHLPVFFPIISSVSEKITFAFRGYRLDFSLPLPEAGEQGL
jgi:hypothetical protein